MPIYNAFGLTVMLTDAPVPVGTGLVESQITFDRSLVRIKITELGSNVIELAIREIEKHVIGGVELIHIHIPITTTNTDGLVDNLILRGFAFAAMFPGYDATDILILQFLNRVKVTLQTEDLFSGTSSRIFREIGLPKLTKTRMA
jgi:hypothetical protein